MKRQNILNARVTFRNSPIHVLERFTIRDVYDAYEQFRKHSDLDECVIIQTCNRIELFAKSDSITDNESRIKRTWASLTGLDEADFNTNMKISRGDDALYHLLKLTSGLDSMVVGEEQILGQIKESITTARQMHASGRHMNTLFDKAIKIGTRIRNNTGVGKGGISVGSMAVKLAEENIDDLKSKKILLIGTGEVSTLVAKSLLRRRYAFDITSRTMTRARAFCESMGGTPVRFENVLSGFTDYDVMFVATTAPYSLVTYERLSQAMSDSDDTSSLTRPGMMILDLSNPRTVDERVATIAGIKLMNLDQISEMVEKNMSTRSGKIQVIENMIKEEVNVLDASMRRLDAEPIAEHVFKSIEALRVKELQKGLRTLHETDPRRIKIIDDLTREIVESVLSAPMNNLRKASERDDAGVIAFAKKLFDYDVYSVDMTCDNDASVHDASEANTDDCSTGDDVGDDTTTDVHGSDSNIVVDSSNTDKTDDHNTLHV